VYTFKNTIFWYLIGVGKKTQTFLKPEASSELKIVVNHICQLLGVSMINPQQLTSVNFCQIHHHWFSVSEVNYYYYS